MTASDNNANTGRKKGRLRRRLIYGGYLSVVTLVLLEIALRIYNPFHFRLKGDRILLPINQRETIVNRINPKLDPVIINTRNSLGFRGPEPPKDWGRALTVITIGGSTTECHFLSDSLTWPYLLGRRLAVSVPGCWLNNAGLDGQSTFGHILMLNDHVKQLRPSVVVFLTGVNDMETDRPSFHDKLYERGAFPDFKHWLFNNSEVLNLGLNLWRSMRARRFNNTTNSMMVLDSVRRLVLPALVVRARLEAQEPYLEGYRRRLSDLADTCLAWKIVPVFVTQPDLFGFGRDPVTGADLAAFPVESGVNGRLLWEMLERYNDVVRSLCAQRHLRMIDLARLMPKNSLYFYDMSHFTNQGAAEVAGLLAPTIDSIFSRVPGE
ncbi:MAG TPA: SGNH/GDSL hydrolase family protein [Puia sp.]|jgi:lysophospholipase L1-like esterase|nr:SGNH/GDSL hydrolase family protein [Puia sp.]